MTRKAPPRAHVAGTSRLFPIATAGMSAVFTLVSFAFAAMIPAPLQAQERVDTVPLREVVVTATRLPALRHAVPAAVTVITGDELRAHGVRFVADALRAVPGVHLAGGGAHGAITSVFLRGGESDHVQVLIDGIPVNEPGGAYDFAHLTTHDIARIEIVRGPVSVLYGTDAVAGVIQIFTREGRDVPSVRGSLERGRFDRRGPAPGGEAAAGSVSSVGYDAALGGAAGDVRYALGVSGFGTAGLLAANSEYANRTASARLRWTPADALAAPSASAQSDVAASLRWTDHRYHFPTDGGGRIVDHNQFTTGTSLALGLEVARFVTPRVETRASVRLHRSDSGFDDQPDSPADTIGFFAAESTSRILRRSADVRANLHLARATATLGVTGEWQAGTSLYRAESSFGPYEDETDDARASRAGYAQLVASPVHSLSLTVGGRVEHSSMFGRFATYRVGANVRAARALTLRGALGTAFKEPTFYENFAAGIVRGNPDLDPERSRSAELGALLQLAELAVSATLYRQRFEDLIQFDARPAAERPGEANYFNLAAAAASGIELEIAGRVASRTTLRAAYNYLVTRVDDAGTGADRAFLVGRPLLRRPAHAGSMAVSARTSGRLLLTVSARAVGERADLDFAEDWQGERVTLPAYATVGAGAEITALRTERLGELAFTVRLENALDARYEEIRNFPARGRVLYVGAAAGSR